MPRKKKLKEQLDLTIYTKSGKLRKRKPKQNRNYFTQETEDAIIEFVKSDDKIFKDRLFKEKINDSFYKLAENIIHTFKFYYTDLDNVEDLKHEVVVFLLERLHLYNQNKGKAYSYFGTIAKRYLITYNDQNYKSRVDRKELDDVDTDKKVIVESQTEKGSNELSHFIDSYIKYVNKNINKYFTSQKEKDVVSSIMTIFEKRENISDVINKQNLYLQIKEMTGQNTQFITKIVKKLNVIRQQQMNIYYRVGSLEVEETDIYI